MQIKYFNQLLAWESRPHVLKDCAIVVDAHNYFYTMYNESKLPSAAGCESDRFAAYLKAQLGMYKQANVKCYFVFKGGSKDPIDRWNKNVKKTVLAASTVIPLFAKNICRQVLDDMGFDYVISQFEAKEQCLALAKQLKCPVLSNDIEIGIFSDSYVNSKHLTFDPSKKGIKCKLVQFKSFLTKYNLSHNKFVFFVLLTDATLYREGYFSVVLQKMGAPEKAPEKYLTIFKWLSATPESEIMNEILKCFSVDERKTIIAKEKDVRARFTLPEIGIPYQYFIEKEKLNITKNDPQWFEKGIALRYIAIPYINLYTDGVTDASWVCKDNSKPNTILLSADIIKYALNLLTNYTKASFEFLCDNGDKIKVNTEMLDVPKPNYSVSRVVFENGWNRIPQLKLLEHFVRFTVRGADLELLREVPADARLLMVALIYMAHKNQAWGERQAYSVMFSFVSLCNNKYEIRKRDFMSESDRRTVFEAVQINSSKHLIIDNKEMYTLFQFQNCLENMNYLNALCGFSYDATDYSRTYSGELVYNILQILIQTELQPFVKMSTLLKSAPTVLAFFKKLVDLYTRIGK